MLTTLLAFANTIAIIPQPSIVIPQPGGFDLNAQTVISADKGLANVATRLREYWKTGTGLELPNGSGTSNVIRIKLDSKAKLGEEGYRLTVDPQMVEIVAAKPAGAFYAVQSLRQLLPADSFGNKKIISKARRTLRHHRRRPQILLARFHARHRSTLHAQRGNQEVHRYPRTP